MKGWKHSSSQTWQTQPLSPWIPSQPQQVCQGCVIPSQNHWINSLVRTTVEFWKSLRVSAKVSLNIETHTSVALGASPEHLRACPAVSAFPTASEWSGFIFAQTAASTSSALTFSFYTLLPSMHSFTGEHNTHQSGLMHGLLRTKLPVRLNSEWPALRTLLDLNSPTCTSSERAWTISGMWDEPRVVA